MVKELGPPLEAAFAALLARRRSRNQLRRLTTLPSSEDGTPVVDFSSNSYLSLSSLPAVQQAFLARLRLHAATTTTIREGGGRGYQLLGSGGSRLLDGNSPLAEQLERDIAAFHGAPAALLFNSGFDANTGLFACAPQPGDVVVYDELIHASIHDGMRLSRAGRRLPFAHSCVYGIDGGSGGISSGDDAGSISLPGLDTLLRRLTEGGGERELAVRDGRTNVFVAVEAVYSMDGDVAPLREVVECVERRLPRGNGYVVVDEAHSTGLFGDRGRGLVCELGLEGRVWARVHTFGKAMGCSGAVVLTSPTTREYLINYARSLIYTTAMAFTALASIQTSYEFVGSPSADALRTRLRGLVAQAHARLALLCDGDDRPMSHGGQTPAPPPPWLFRVLANVPRSPIIPVFTARPRSLARHCRRRGFMVRPIVAPTVAVGTERVRICLHAGNTAEEVEGLCAAMREWLSLQVVGAPEREEEEQQDDPDEDSEARPLSRAGEHAGDIRREERVVSKAQL